VLAKRIHTTSTQQASRRRTPAPYRASKQNLHHRFLLVSQARRTHPFEERYQLGVRENLWLYASNIWRWGEVPGGDASKPLVAGGSTHAATGRGPPTQQLSPQRTFENSKSMTFFIATSCKHASKQLQRDVRGALEPHGCSECMGSEAAQKIPAGEIMKPLLCTVVCIHTGEEGGACRCTYMVAACLGPGQTSSAAAVPAIISKLGLLPDCKSSAKKLLAWGSSGVQASSPKRIAAKLGPGQQIPLPPC